MKIDISGKTVEIVQGDISLQTVDAIVNAANNHLWMGSGVAGAIKRMGGTDIEKEAVRKGPIAIGESVYTSAGNLRAKNVIHAAVMGQDLKTDEKKVRDATKSALRVARELDSESVALPALGTGVGGFPVKRAAEI
ncbi:MAG TPA: Appr-1-p processing protein, partial [Euryarchaeota archaeon]|nr:Appr-1-p processing protein [Euryarchaeota archaeon]